VGPEPVPIDNEVAGDAAADDVVLAWVAFPEILTYGTPPISNLNTELGVEQFTLLPHSQW